MDPVELREMLFGTREPFSYLHCRTCGLLQIREIPADLGQYYPAAYYQAGGEIEPDRVLGPLRRAADRSQNANVLFGSDGLMTRALERFRPRILPEVGADAPFIKRAGLRRFDDPILDVGAGRVPSRLARLRRIGFTNLTGIDPWLTGDAFLPHIRLLQREIHEVKGSFKLVMFHHAFEHVPDPESVLLAASRLLRPDGTILIRTPVMESWFWREYGRDWWELDPPRHLVLQSVRSLGILASRVGLEIAHLDFDSTFVEILASEQIRRDVAWREPGSWFVDPPAGFTPAAIDEAKAVVGRLNREGEAGRAAFYLRPVGRPS